MKMFVEGGRQCINIAIVSSSNHVTRLIGHLLLYIYHGYK